MQQLFPASGDIPITRRKLFHRLRMGKIEPAPSRNEELAPDRRLVLSQYRAQSCRRNNFRRPQARRTTSHDEDVTTRHEPSMTEIARLG